MLKKIRVGVSVALFSLITFYFVDFAGLMHGKMAGLPAKVQLIPAALASAFAVLVALAVLTLLFGRVYCSSICPMGVYQDIVAWIAKRAAKKKKRYKFSKPKNLLRAAMLAATLAIFLQFPLILAFIDPYSAYGRIAANVFRPVYMAGNNALEAIFTQFGSYTFYKTDVFVAGAFSFAVAMLTMLAIGYMAWRHGRTYCNTICPAGTILGFLSKFSIFKIRVDQGKCNSCGLCEMSCKAACISSKQKSVDSSRCVDCFSCLNACRRDALTFSPALMPKKMAAAWQDSAATTPTERSVDEGKRRFLTAGVATVASAPAAMAMAGGKLGSLTGSSRYVRQHPILPPGAVSVDNMLKHCTSCHLCISKCPSRALKPAFMEYGLAGLMQPTMYFEKGFCNFDCTICSEVCPNGAIKPLTKEEKHLNQSGYVVFSKELCVVQTDETSCGACSEHCPTQAVTMVPYKDGLTIPHINVEICIGCGGCEFICPVRPFRAIHIEGHAVQGKAKPFEEQEKEDREIESFGF
ncbi:MAG: 4Fe-4S dicluster domain-containing protein [Prevotellaceae bacterium]|jgi:polyferredoxin|nr:4Fe-4S dicluster domain-containing protein [Prevotellaceae bacterium]